jgi:hypothetical protein
MYTLKDLQNMDTIRESQTDSLKFEGERPDGSIIRVWLSRMTKEDGMPYDNQITVEGFNGDKWVTLKQYPGGDWSDATIEHSGELPSHTVTRYER